MRFFPVNRIFRNEHDVLFFQYKIIEVYFLRAGPFADKKDRREVVPMPVGRSVSRQIRRLVFDDFDVE